MKSALEQLNKAQSSKTSLIEQNHGKSTLDDYETDAPELESNADKSSSSSSSSSDSSASKSSSSDSSSRSSSSSESSK